MVTYKGKNKVKMTVNLKLMFMVTLLNTITRSPQAKPISPNILFYNILLRHTGSERIPHRFYYYCYDYHLHLCC